MEGASDAKGGLERLNELGTLWIVINGTAGYDTWKRFNMYFYTNKTCDILITNISNGTTYSTHLSNCAYNGNAFTNIGRLQWGKQGTASTYVDNFQICSGACPTVLAPVVSYLNQTFINISPANITTLSIISLGRAVFNYTITNFTSSNSINLYVGLNSSELCLVKVQGICRTLTNTYYPFNYTTNYSPTNYSWTINDTQIMASNTLMNYSLFATSGNRQNINLSTSTSLAKFLLLNISNLTEYNVVEMYVNNSGVAGTASVYYCNSSRISSNPATSENCTILITIPQAFTYNHTESSGGSYYNFQMPISNGKVNNLVKVTNSNYIVLKKNINPGTWMQSYDTAQSYLNGTEISTDNGATWTNISGIADIMLHRISSIDQVCWRSQTDGTNETAYYCDAYEISDLPPTPVQITSPTAIAYGGNIWVNYTNASDSGGISFYNISLCNSNLSFNQTIKSNNSLNNSYYWNPANVTDGNYTICVTATDMVNQTSIGYSPEFAIDHTLPLVVISAPLNESVKSNNTNISITASCTDLNSIYSARFNITAPDSQVVYNSTNITLNVLFNINQTGNYFINYSCNDTAGNFNQTFILFSSTVPSTNRTPLIDARVYYSFDLGYYNATGNITDLSAYKVHGHNQSSAFFGSQGILGSSLNLSTGAAGYANITNKNGTPAYLNLSTDQNLTINLWVKWASFVGGSYIYGIDNTELGSNGFFLFVNSTGTAGGNLTLGAGNGTVDFKYYTTLLNASTWYNIMLTYNTTADTWTMYLNNVAQGTLNKRYIVPATANLFIGENNNPVHQSLNAYIDEFSVYDYVLNASERNMTYNGGHAFNPFSTLVTIISPLSGSTYYSTNNSVDLSYIIQNTSIVNCSYSLNNDPFVSLPGCQNITLSTPYGINELILFVNGTNESFTSFSQFNLYAGQFNVVFYDELTKNIINDTTISMDEISGNYSASFSTTTGTLSLNVINLTQGVTTLRYSDEYRSERFYFVNLTDIISQNLTLYLLNSSLATNITYTIIDNFANPIEGAYIKASRYYLASNSYELVAMAQSDVSGIAIMPLQFSAEFYKYFVNYPFSTLRLETNGSYINSQTLTLQLDLNAIAGANYDQAYNIDKNLSFNNVTGNFRFTYSSPSSQTVTTKVNVYRLSSTGRTLVNTSTIDSAAATILLSPGTLINDTQYIAEAFFIIEGEQILVGQASYIIPESNSFGILGLSVVIILTIALVCIMFYNIPLALILTPLPALCSTIIGILPKELLPWVSGMEIAFIFLAIYIGWD